MMITNFDGQDPDADQLAAIDHITLTIIFIIGDSLSWLLQLLAAWSSQLLLRKFRGLDN